MMKIVTSLAVFPLSLLLWVTPAEAQHRSTVSQKSKSAIQKNHLNRVAKRSKARKAKSKVAHKTTEPYAGGYGPKGYTYPYGSSLPGSTGDTYLPPTFEKTILRIR
jgi:hypothetical protein